jgi:uncharacterized membrane-anchored protein
MNSALIATGLIFLMLFSILSSLAVGLYYLLHDEGKTKRAVKALRLRIILSLVLFVALWVAFGFGWITPHPISKQVSAFNER